MQSRLKVVVLLLAAASVATAVLVAGCAKPTQQSSAPQIGAAPQAAEAATEETATCPVMGETMKKSEMIPVEHNGKTYYLCCRECLGKFKANPDKYIDK